MIYDVLKRIFDIVLSAVAIVFFLPLAIYVVIRLKKDTDGPVFFKQERVGKGGKPFMILKFRTMIVESENDGIPRLAEAEDDRLTTFGKWLRNHHLDELPQLWNVLRGDMAFVGYRPERKYFIDQIMEQDSRYSLLYKIRPGVTSYATLYNGYTYTMEKMLRRLQLDLYYLEHRSLRFDVKILWLTFVSIALGRKF